MFPNASTANAVAGRFVLEDVDFGFRRISAILRSSPFAFSPCSTRFVYPSALLAAENSVSNMYPSPSRTGGVWTVSSLNFNAIKFLELCVLLKVLEENLSDSSLTESALLIFCTLHIVFVVSQLIP